MSRHGSTFGPIMRPGITTREREAARDVLDAILADGAVLAADAYAAAAAGGVNPDALNAAARDAGILRRQDADGRWHWMLPSDADAFGEGTA